MEDDNRRDTQSALWKCECKRMMESGKMEDGELLIKSSSSSSHRPINARLFEPRPAFSACPLPRPKPCPHRLPPRHSLPRRIQLTSAVAIPTAPYHWSLGKMSHAVRLQAVLLPRVLRGQGDEDCFVHPRVSSIHMASIHARSHRSACICRASQYKPRKSHGPRERGYRTE